MIHGTIPEAFRQWKQLQLLQLDNNLMHGTIPHWLSELGALVWLGLSAFAGQHKQWIITQPYADAATAHMQGQSWLVSLQQGFSQLMMSVLGITLCLPVMTRIYAAQESILMEVGDLLEQYPPVWAS